MEKMLTTAFLLVMVVSTTSFSEEKTLTSSGNTGLGKWEVISKMEEIDIGLLRNSTEQSVRDFLKTVDYLTSKGSKQIIYKYTYVFNNYSIGRFKINFSEWGLIHSPLTKIVQDFSFELGIKASKVVVFLANSVPHEISSPVNIAFWDEPHNRWIILGVGKAAFFIPEWDTDYTELKKQL